MDIDSNSKAVDLFRARADWARKCIDNFVQHMDTFLQERPYEAKKHVKDTGKCEFEITFVMKVQREVPCAVRFACGDAIHNLRALIDNLVWALAKTMRLTNKHGNLSLRFYERRDEFVKEYLPKIESFPSTIREWIEYEQPYSRPQEFHILHCINMLWNEDKHRTPVLMASASHGMDMQGQLPWNRFYAKTMQANAGIVRDGETMVIMTVPTRRDVYSCNPKFMFDLAFARNNPAHHIPARTFLKNAHRYILDEVLPKFDPFLK
jgi:hypothetical protein